MSAPAKLALADGTVFTGSACGASGEIFGEVVFNTSMTGYQEILTDPSYRGQIVTMTYPLIGNYGINLEDVESAGISLSGFVVRELCREPSNYRSRRSLDDYLRDAGIIGLEGIDTRALVRRIRVQGAMTGVLSTVELNDAKLIAKAQSSPDIVGRDLVQEVMPDCSAEWSESLSSLGAGFQTGNSVTFAPRLGEQAPHVVAIDYGMKFQRPRRSAPARLCGGNNSQSVGQEADLRDLLGAPASRPRQRRQDFQIEIRTPGSQSARFRSPQQPR
jgi:carbamoyl-phosphate synthase small subunit